MEGIDETTTTITIEVSTEDETNYERTEVEESQNSYRSEKDGEEMMNVNMADEEKRFLRIIKKIQNQRNRACYQNLLEFAGRENKNINMDICKAIVDNLVREKTGSKQGENWTRRIV